MTTTKKKSFVLQREEIIQNKNEGKEGCIRSTGEGGGMTDKNFKEDKMKRGSQEKEDIVAKALTY